MADRIDTKNIVCLGGGVGTSMLLRGLKKFNPNLTIITSMADDGGSSGRLRKGYNIMPPGDIINCIAALIPEEEKELESLLLYRFSGNDKANKTIDGHKFGNLLMLAEVQRTKDFYKAIDVTKKMFGVTANILPATDQRVHLWAMTKDRRRVHSETTLDLALYSEPHGLEKVYITPAKPKVNRKVVDSLRKADVIISGPGDLFTNQLPVMIVPEVKEALLESKAKKIFILNIANKPFETKGFTLSDFIAAITHHLGMFPFDIVIANNNYENRIPTKYHYRYIKLDKEVVANPPFTFIQADIVNDDFPLYHNPQKLAEVIKKAI